MELEAMVLVEEFCMWSCCLMRGGVGVEVGGLETERRRLTGFYKVLRLPPRLEVTAGEPRDFVGWAVWRLYSLPVGLAGSAMGRKRHASRRDGMNCR